MNEHLTRSQQTRLNLVVEDLENALINLQQLRNEVETDGKRTLKDACHRLEALLSELEYGWPE